MHFNGLLLTKVYNVSGQKKQRSYFNGTQDKKFKRKVICCFKNDKNLVDFDPSTQKSQKFAL